MYFVDDGGGVTLGEASAIATQVAAYQPGVVALPEGGFLVVWSEGDSPEFEVWGRYLVSAVEPAEF